MKKILKLITKIFTLLLTLTIMFSSPKYSTVQNAYAISICSEELPDIGISTINE